MCKGPSDLPVLGTVFLFPPLVLPTNSSCLLWKEDGRHWTSLLRCHLVHSGQDGWWGMSPAAKQPCLKVRSRTEPKTFTSKMKLATFLLSASSTQIQVFLAFSAGSSFDDWLELPLSPGGAASGTWSLWEICCRTWSLAPQQHTVLYGNVLQPPLVTSNTASFLYTAFLGSFAFHLHKY